MVHIDRLIDSKDLSLLEIMGAGIFSYECGTQSFHVISKYNPRLKDHGLIDNIKDFVETAEFKEIDKESMNWSICSAMINALFYQGVEVGIYHNSGECEVWDRHWNRYRVMGSRELFLLFKQVVGI